MSRARDLGRRRRHSSQYQQPAPPTWREWATDVRGFAIDSGHYLAEEAPEATAKALLSLPEYGSTGLSGLPRRFVNSGCRAGSACPAL